MWRIAAERPGVGLLCRECSARTQQPPGLGEQTLGLAAGRSQKAHVDQIETALRQARRISIAFDDFDVRRGALPGDGNEGRVEFHANDPAIRADTLAQRVGESLWTATEIDAAPASRNTDSIEKHIGIRGPGIVLQAQPFEFVGAYAFDGIVA